MSLITSYNNLEALIISRKNRDPASTDYNFFDFSGKNLLHYAAQLGDTGKITYLLNQKANIDALALRPPQVSAFALALEAGQLTAAQLLYTRGAKGFQIKLENVTDTACRAWLVAQIREELALEVDLKSEASSNEKRLKNRFIQPDEEGEINVAAIVQRCAEIDDVTTLKKFIRVDDSKYFRDFMINDSSRFGAQEESLPTIASANGSLDVLRELMSINHPSVAPEMFHETPLQAAATNNRIDSLEFLLKNNQTPNFLGSSKMSPLATAIANQDQQAVSILLDNGALIGSRDHNGRNELHHACIAGDPEILQLLLKRPEANFFINFRDIYGKSPLDYAVSYGHDDIIKTLVPAEQFAAIKSSPYYQQRPSCVAQSIILFKMHYYLQLESRNVDDLFKDNGHCNGFEFLSDLYSDEYFFSTATLLAKWNGTQDALDTPFSKDIPQAKFYKSLRELIEQWTNDLVWFQHTTVKNKSRLTQKQRTQQLKMIEHEPIDFKEFGEIPNADYSRSQCLEMMSLLWSHPVGTILTFDSGDHVTRARLNADGSVSYYDSNFLYQTVPVNNPLDLFNMVFDYTYLDKKLRPWNDPILNIGFKFSRIESKLSEFSEEERQQKITDYFYVPRSLEEAQQSQSPNKFTLAHIAVLTRNPTLLRKVLASDVVDINARDDKGRSALELAIQTDAKECVKMICEVAKNLNISKELVEAHKPGNYEYFEFLFNHQAAKNLPELLDMAIGSANLSLVQRIINEGKITESELKDNGDFCLRLLIKVGQEYLAICLVKAQVYTVSVCIIKCRLRRYQHLSKIQIFILLLFNRYLI